MKKIVTRICFICLLCGPFAAAFSQIDSAASYFARIGNADALFIRSDDGATLDFILFANPLESGTGSITANQTGIFATSRGRQVTFTLSGNGLTGTFAGTSFSAQRESSVGPQAAAAGGYYGIMQDRLRVNTDTYDGDFFVFPSGRVVLFVDNTLGALTGVGTRTAAGAVTVNLSTGVVLRFNFAGDKINGWLPVTVSGLSTATSFQYNFFRVRESTVVNIATRSRVAPGQPMTAGFVITEGTKTVLIRAVGPTLGVFGVPGVNPDPGLRLFSGQTVIAQNDNWTEAANSSDITTAALQVGAFALAAGSRDAAMLVTLKPGAYTAEAASVGAAAGDTLVEVYEVSK